MVNVDIEQEMSQVCATLFINCSHLLVSRLLSSLFAATEGDRVPRMHPVSSPYITISCMPALEAGLLLGIYNY